MYKLCYCASILFFPGENQNFLSGEKQLSKDFQRSLNGLKALGGKETGAHRACTTGLVRSGGQRTLAPDGQRPLSALPPLSCVNLINLQLPHPKNGNYI